MSGVMHAPLMGIFLTAELTGGYALFLPLLIVSTISYGTIKFFMPYSIYTMRLAQRGELLTHHKDKGRPHSAKDRQCHRDRFPARKPRNGPQRMVDTISQSKRNLFPCIMPKRISKEW